MVSTRRQSGVIPKPSSALQRSLDAAEASENDCNSEDKEPKVINAPSAKRRKTTPKASANGANVVAKPRRRGKDLSLLPTMPLDILYEILGQLAPKDLLSLSRTNKRWRSTVVSAGTEFLWRDARKAFRAPEPPKDFTEQRWAGLLFETTCDSCGKKGSTVDWLLLRRACVECKRKQLMYAPKFKSTFPGEDKDVLNHVPHTKTGVSARRSRSGGNQSKFYWIDDIELALDQTRVLRGKELAEWKVEMTEGIEERANMFPEYEKWTRHLDQLSREDLWANRDARLRLARQRLVESGYESVDVRKAVGARSEGIYTGVPRITNAVWTKIRPALEQRVIRGRNKRLAAELQLAVLKRMKILSELYDDYLDLNLRPSERYYCPPIESFRPIPEVMKLPIVENFDRYIAEYQEEKENSFEALVPQASRGKADQHSFDLAQNVFRRVTDENDYYYTHYGSSRNKPEDDVLVGWSMLGTHWSSSRRKLEIRPGVYLDMPQSFGYNPGASLCSSQLIALAGLDPNIATVEHMDAVDPRFVYTDFATAIGYPVFTWRGAIAVDSRGDGRPNRHFRLTMSDEEAEAKANEDALRGTAKAWSCNHCAGFLGSDMAEMRAVLLKHIQEEHGISNPKLLEDYFVNERCCHAFERPYEILVPDVQKYKCDCMSCSRYGYRAFSKDKLDAHLITAFPYSWAPPVEGTHYWPVRSGRDAKAGRIEGEA